MAEVSAIATDAIKLIKMIQKSLTDGMRMSDVQTLRERIMFLKRSIEEADEKLALAVTSGKLKVDGAEMIVDVEGKLEEIPRIWNWLFEGKNTGKLITKVSSE